MAVTAEKSVIVKQPQGSYTSVGIANFAGINITSVAAHNYFSSCLLRTLQMFGLHTA
jgi:hypothetical protein